MKNSIGNQYKRYVLWRHLKFSIGVTLILAVAVWIVDTVFNHYVMDIIANTVAWQLADVLRKYKSPICVFLYALAFFFSWMLVELHELRGIAEVLNKMESALADDEEEIQLNKRFQTIEDSVNAIKLKNRLNAEKARMEVERKNDLITYLAHDIRTPLASVIGYLSLLDEVPDLPVEQRAKYTGITLKKAYRLEELINEFFDITRFNLSSLPLEKEEIPLRFMLEQLADEFYPMLSSGNRRVEISVSEELAVYGDADKLARVFGNLIKNAVSYSYENTAILINAGERRVEGKGLLLLTVSNEGRQIPPEKLKMIFDKFFRLDNARSSNTGGAGLGLAIAKEIIVQHGGSIYASSDEKHTVFTVVLPAAGG